MESLPSQEETFPVIEISQILPDDFIREIPLKRGLCMITEKNKTAQILSLLKEQSFLMENVILKIVKEVKQEKVFARGNRPKQFGCCVNSQKKIPVKDNDYALFDLSFLKRVKPVSKEKNLILLTFIEHLEYIEQYEKLSSGQLDEQVLIQNFIGFFIELLDKKSLMPSKDLAKTEEIFTIENIPIMQPLSESQYAFCKTHWPLFNLPTSLSNDDYTHSSDEVKELCGVVKDLLNLHKASDIESLLYDSVSKKILSQAKRDDIDPFGHSIMMLIDSFSREYLVPSDDSREENVDEILLQESVLSKKQPNTPQLGSEILFIDILASERAEQYYCQNLYVFTITEPCIMCSMALVHSRISRIYFLNPNLSEGGIISQIKINNYNLNHHYLSFQIHTH